MGTNLVISHTDYSLVHDQVTCEEGEDVHLPLVVYNMYTSTLFMHIIIWYGHNDIDHAHIIM